VDSVRFSGDSGTITFLFQDSSPRFGALSKGKIMIKGSEKMSFAEHFYVLAGQLRPV